MSILIVEDQPDNLLILRKYLEKGGFRDILEVSSTIDCLSVLGIEPLSNTNTGSMIDLILLDLIERNSFELCKKIKKSPKYQTTPIIVITDVIEPKNFQEIFKNDVVDFITKPINPIQLISRVNTIFTLKQKLDFQIQTNLRLLNSTQQLMDENKKLKNLSNIDILTGVFNRQHFDSCLRREWRRASREGREIALIMIDIDNFKNYNDHYGHQGGDTCLKVIAMDMKKVIHRPGDWISRFEGEKFGVLLYGTDEKGACVVAKRLLQTVYDLSLPHPNSNTSSRVTISLGVAATFPTSKLPPDTLISSVSQALYQAKNQGRNCISLSSKLPK